MTGSEHLDKLFDKPAAHRRHWSLPPVSRTVLIRTGAGLAALVIVVALVVVVVAHSGSVLRDLALLAPLLLVSPGTRCTAGCPTGTSPSPGPAISWPTRGSPATGCPSTPAGPGWMGSRSSARSPTRWVLW